MPANADRAATLLAGLKLPVIVAPMFLISGPDLVIAAAKAGIIGAFPAPNARTIADLRAWLARITTELGIAHADHWAINMIVHPSYDRFEAELDLICEYKPKIVITALGSPRRPLARVHDYGGLVFSDVISPEQAKKAADAGADGLILVASGAGGHTGTYSAFAFVAASGPARWCWAAPSAARGPSAPPKCWARISPIWAPASSPAQKAW
jgi:nitronate monooxygenase